MAIDITELVNQLTGELRDNAFKASDSLGRIGSEQVVDAMISLLGHANPESRILAARTLGLVANNSKALEPILAAIKDKENSAISGELLMALEGFDISSLYVELFRLYLFGSYKVSMTARELLDYKEFDITPRVLKKAMKHWDHYIHNVGHDEAYELRKAEVEEMLADIRAYLEENSSSE
jgi:hypothetical protein